MSRCNPKHRNRSRSPCSSSDSGSSSESYCEETEVKIIEKHKMHKKHDKHDKHHSESESDHDNKKKKCKKQDKNNSDTEDEKRCFDDVYKYYKWKLLNDDSLMVGGSSCYGNLVNDVGLTIPTSYAAEYSKLLVNNNINYSYVGAPVYVREDGVYVVFFIALTDQSCQFTIFVNGIPEYLTSLGSNAGAGQLVSRHMLKLKKDDNVVVRNYVSSNSAVTSKLYTGGSQVGNDLTFVLLKIAPLCPPVYDCKNWEVFEKCLSKRKKCLFKKLLDKMLCDKELMLKGFNVRGTFYTKLQQSVLTETDVMFDNYSNVNGLTWNPSGSNPEQIKVCEDGVYKVFGLLTSNTAVQFALCVNGIPMEYTTQGTNRGAGQLTLRTLLELKKNDVITLRNHTSPNSHVIISQNAGGLISSISAILTVFKCAPLCKYVSKPCEIDCGEYYKCSYEKFKNYLLCNDKLQIAGSGAYGSYTSATHQTVHVGTAFDWNNNVINYNLMHQPGTQDVIIERDGVYDMFADIITDEPAQLTIFINNTPDLSTVFGRDSGATRCLIRQFVKLNKGDVVSVRNYESSSGTLNTSINPGGNLVGQSALFLLFMLSPNCENDKVHWEPDCKKK
jgi:hypothetical protein